MSSRFFTPLRYPGGKSGLGQWVAHLMRYNRISGGTYVEPYAGGAGVALYLLLNEYVNQVVINDIDPLIYNFWLSVTNEPEKLIKLITDTDISVDNWRKQKEVIKKASSHSPLEQGFAAFYLNRTNRSGILKGGVIGGLNQSGNYKINARFNKENLIKRIERIANKRKSIKVLNLDALSLIEQHYSESNPKSLIYLDPPYFNKGSQLYRNFYSPDDHASIAQAITKVKTPWMITYDNCQQIKSLYNKEESIEFSLTYSASTSRPLATEILVYDNLSLPRQPVLKRSTRPYPKEWDTAA